MLANKDYSKAQNLLMPIYKKLERKIFKGSEAQVDVIKKFEIKDPDEFFAFSVIAERLFAINQKLNKDSVSYYAKIAYTSMIVLKNYELKKSGDIISTHKEKAKLEKKQLETALEIKQHQFVIFVFIGFSILIILFLIFDFHAEFPRCVWTGNPRKCRHRRMMRVYQFLSG